MEKAQSDRMKAVVHWWCGQTGKKQIEVAQYLGYSNKSYFSQILNGQTGVPTHLPAKLAALDPRINLDYLLGTSDEMLITSSVAPAPPVAPPAPQTKKGIVVPPELAGMFADMTATIKSQQELILKLTDHLTK